ncbi:hypothetical protein [Aestuariivirga sp.]|uniref:hypothetical protein n=1 Tax=Aestuariivirga sp. TaxID=2650926 RepID=UPI0025BF6A28|nr:hypothetical protein [Aestuariivirga sp.]MCA3555140.1 hypothetical protein [Aestuariivirga sp.]
MTAASRAETVPLAAHATCAAAGVRDGLRAAQYYIRDLASADRFGKGEAHRVPFLSRVVARGARMVDGLMNRGANLSIALFLPSWRKLPSPFTPGLMHAVAKDIRNDRLAHNPTFNAYFYRAAIHVAGRYSSPPWLILEHRVDAARRSLAPRLAETVSDNEMMARILIALVGQGPVARIGAVSEKNRFFAKAEANVAVFSIACVALMFAADGKPTGAIDEDGFFTVTGALIGPRLSAIARLVEANDEAGLARELADIKSMY